MQTNNNATKNSQKVNVNVSDLQEPELFKKGYVTRSMTESANGRPTTILKSDKVKWTKEFLDKVRKSNEKHAKQSKIVNSNDVIPLLQEQQKDKQLNNDGIVTTVEGIEELSEEELDYEDDLSMLDEGFPLNEEIISDSVRPGTSQQTKDHENGSEVVNQISQMSKEQLASNPVIQRMMQKFFKDQFKNLQMDQPAGKGTGKKSMDFKSAKDKIPQTRVIKSPSDTTIYAPAMQQRITPNEERVVILNSGQGTVRNVVLSGERPIQSVMLQDDRHLQNDFKVNKTDIAGTLQHVVNPTHVVNTNQISDFVENVRVQQHPEDQEVNRRCSDMAAANLEEAQRRAERSILEAEKFKASIEAPGLCNNEFLPNMFNNHLAESNNITSKDQGEVVEQINLLNIGTGVSDDDFFHLTCHIEPSLIHKIEKGEFVELEKLLPKDKLGSREENRLEWVQKDGGTFLVPAQHDNKIGSFRRWEQAFRAYATIYCSANPHRSKEIWQYISVINTTASSYIWDNVYNYDITFRHLMAFNPQRSWAVTYNQMWNLSMRDPIPRNNGRPAFQHYSEGGIAAPGKGRNGKPMQVRRNKSNYCWNFNKGVPCKFGSKCKFIERCKYCDSPSHGVNACTKLLKKDNGKTSAGGVSQTGSGTNGGNAK